MTTVTFATFCHPPHLTRLHTSGVLSDILASHRYPFDDVLVVHQRCQGLQYTPIPYRVLESENYPHILSDFGLPEEDPVADEWTHGPGAAHYWKWHCINHLIALSECRTDYIVFSDCDCLIVSSDAARSWVEEAISILKKYPDVLLVGPGDGGDMMEARIPEARLTRNVSQQLFLVNAERFRQVDFNVPWNWEKLAPGGPFQEFYYLMEGRIWRYLDKHNLWRAVLPDTWRYWHYNPWTPKAWIEAGRP